MKLQSHQGEIKAKKEEETLAKQQAQVQEQQQKIQEEQEQQRKEEEELAKQKAEQELLIKQRREAKQYQELKEELVKAEQKIASIANVVDGEADVILESAKLPETLDGEDNEGQIQKVKVLVEQAEAKIKNLESVLDK
eukprot:CAMPEP_0113645098 /NCGR_PEP_ID=MMETSP0017_2-20120614/23749_1 /TAXON_ID=2856 /ORGANISM="Cylindrotheca closterium" /LENGTH=137 /DNA_ID=CAMNT_0000556771 /DNA_START=198 /DNA_END=611 /DNA_ORIENTATION=- /assembly_acc=CAM_ASM_000147